MKTRFRRGLGPGLGAALGTAVLALLLTSCAPRESEPLVVWSDVSEMAFVIERYNYIHDQQVRFVPVDDLTQALTQEAPEADLVVGRWVHTPVVNALMLPYRNTLAPEAYQHIDAGLLALSSPWLPLSFNLPALFASAGQRLPGDGLRLSLADLGELYTEDSGVLHFVPSRSPETMYALQRSLGFSISLEQEDQDETRGGTRDIRGLERSMAAVRAWQREYNGGLEQEAAYSQRLLYERPERLLETGRTTVVYAAGNDLLDWNFTGQRRFHFRWLAGPDGTIHANEDVVYAAVPESSGEREAAARLLAWLIDPQAQQDLIRAKVAARVDSFGIYDGFSTIAEVNRFIAREIVPDVAGRIPRPAAVVFPSALPRYWDEARDAVVAPFMITSPDGEGLERELALWYNQRGD